MKNLILIIAVLFSNSLFSQDKSFEKLRKKDNLSEIIDLDVPSDELHLKVVNGVLYTSIYDDTELDIHIKETKKYSTKKSNVVRYIGVMSGDDTVNVEYAIFYSKEDSDKITHTYYIDEDNDFSTYYTVVY
jgi:hypothetical protein